jgi:hypothetical protein
VSYLNWHLLRARPDTRGWDRAIDMTERRRDDPLRDDLDGFWLERALGLSMTFLLTGAMIVIAVVVLLIALT